jgi:hypothetical protein
VKLLYSQSERIHHLEKSLSSIGELSERINGVEKRFSKIEFEVQNFQTEVYGQVAGIQKQMVSIREEFVNQIENNAETRSFCERELEKVKEYINQKLDESAKVWSTTEETCSVAVKTLNFHQDQLKVIKVLRNNRIP